MHRHVILPIVAAFAAPVHAQNGDAGSWNGEISVTLAPKVGASLPLSTELDPVDNSEFSGAFAIERKGRTGLTDFAIETGITAAPQLLDDNDESSSLYAKATLGDRYVPLPLLLDRLRGNAVAQARPDEVRPYASYQFTKVYSGFLDARTSDDHTVTCLLYTSPSPRD